MSRVMVAILGQAACWTSSCGDDPLPPMTIEPAIGATQSEVRSRPPGSPVVLATALDQDVLGDLFVAGGHVLFGGGREVERSSDTPGPPFETRGVLRRVSREGGPVEELWAGAGGVGDIVGGPSAIYFLTYDFHWRTGTLLRLPRGRAMGAMAVPIGTWSSHGSSHSLAVHGDTAFWTHSAGAGSFVLRTRRDGTTVTLADSTTIGSSADDILFKEGNLYWFSSLAEKTVFRIPAGGGTPTALFAAPDITALGAAPDRDDLYVGAGGDLIRIDFHGRIKTRTILTGKDPIVAIAAGDRAVYIGTWNAETGQGGVARVDRDGGAARVITSGPINPVAIAVDEGSVYWVDALGRTVSRAPR